MAFQAALCSRNTTLSPVICDNPPLALVLRFPNDLSCICTLHVCEEWCWNKDIDLSSIRPIGPDWAVVGDIVGNVYRFHWYNFCEEIFGALVLLMLIGFDIEQEEDDLSTNARVAALHSIDDVA